MRPGPFPFARFLFLFSFLTPSCGHPHATLLHGILFCQPVRVHVIGASFSVLEEYIAESKGATGLTTKPPSGLHRDWTGKYRVVSAFFFFFFLSNVCRAKPLCKSTNG